MTKSKLSFLSFIFIIGSIFLLMLPTKQSVQAYQGDYPTPAPPIPAGDIESGSIEGMTPNTIRHTPSQVRADEALQKTPNATTGGPDNFGYTWKEASSYGWIDATNGTDTGLSGSSWGQATGAISLPFTFKFYEHDYNSVYIAASGYLAFTPSSYWWVPYQFPSPAEPNDVIAPFAVGLQLSNTGPDGRVYYKSGGTAPNRYFVVEWYRVTAGDDIVTFEVILFENGDFAFQYGDMNEGSDGWYSCGASGIEDDMGLDGLAYDDSCFVFSPNKAVRFYRPDPAARVKAFPPYRGHFISPGDTKYFAIYVRNTGELGSDVYDIQAYSSWGVELYHDDYTPVSDSDGDGTPDTGSIAEGETMTLFARVTAPTQAATGDANTAQITFTSSLDNTKTTSVNVQTAVPAPFAQAMTDSGIGSTSLYLVRPREQYAVSPTNNWGGSHAVIQTPGGFLYAWYYAHQNAQGTSVCEVEYVLLNYEGAPLSAVKKLVDHSNATSDTCDSGPSLAMAPNGRVGVVWTSYQKDNSGGYTKNVQFAEIDAKSGNIAIGPVNLMETTDANTFFSAPRVEATADSRFVISFGKGEIIGNAWSEEIYYAVLNPNGSIVHSPSSLGTGYASGILITTGQYEVLLGYLKDWSEDISLVVIDHDGTVTQSNLTVPNSADGWPEDALRLSDGRIVIAWEKWAQGQPTVQFTILNSDYSVSTGPVVLSHPAAEYINGISLATDLEGHIIISWEEGWPLWRYLFYALADSDGTMLTWPTIFWDSDAVYTGWGGQNITSYLTVADMFQVPFIGDWNGDGKDDVGGMIMDVSGKAQFVLYAQETNQQWKIVYPVGTPIIGDWDGDGKDDIGTVVEINGKARYLMYSPTTGQSWQVSYPIGTPIIGDWDGDGKDDVGVVVESNGKAIYLMYSPTTGHSWRVSYPIGTPIIGDWDGDGKDDVGVVVEISGRARYLMYSPTTGQSWKVTYPLGTPIVGDWDGDSKDDIGVVVEQANDVRYLMYSPTTTQSWRVIYTPWGMTH